MLISTNYNLWLPGNYLQYTNYQKMLQKRENFDFSDINVFGGKVSSSF